jgi:hypothetical protein
MIGVTTARAKPRHSNTTARKALFLLLRCSTVCSVVRDLFTIGAKSSAPNPLATCVPALLRLSHRLSIALSQADRVFPEEYKNLPYALMQEYTTVL